MKTKKQIQIGVIITFLASIILCWFIGYPTFVSAICMSLITACYFILYPIHKKKLCKESKRPLWCKYQVDGESVYIGCYELQNDKRFTDQICKQCKYGKSYRS